MKFLARKESVAEDKSAAMDTQKSACLFRDNLRKNNPAIRRDGFPCAAAYGGDHNPTTILHLFCIAAFGALTTNLRLITPGFTGGHRCIDPSDLPSQSPVKQKKGNEFPFFIYVLVIILLWLATFSPLTKENRVWGSIRWAVDRWPWSVNDYPQF
jgi:hypothetical protein